MSVRRKLKLFLRDELGQDIVEMALLLAFVGLTSGAVLVGIGGTVRTLFSVSGDRISHVSKGKSSGTYGTGGSK